MKSWSRREGEFLPVSFRAEARPLPLPNGARGTGMTASRSLDFPRPFGERVPEGRVRGPGATRNQNAKPGNTA